MTDLRRVLVIEDEYLVAMELASTLEDLGYDVCAIVATEEEAVEAAATQRPDLITADVRLRAGDGIAAVARIVAAAPVPTVFITSSDAEVLRRAPAAVRIGKPFDAVTISRAIADAMAASPPGIRA